GPTVAWDQKARLMRPGRAGAPERHRGRLLQQKALKDGNRLHFSGHLNRKRVFSRMVRKPGGLMQLVINTFGASLRKEGERFLVKAGDKQLAVSAHKVRSILLTTAVHLSTDAIQLAIAHNI